MQQNNDAELGSKKYVNINTDEQMEINGYVRSLPKTILTWLMIFLTVGILRLIFYWKPDWMLKCTHAKCKMNDAKKILLQDKYKQKFVEVVKTISRYDKS